MAHSYPFFKGVKTRELLGHNSASLRVLNIGFIDPSSCIFRPFSLGWVMPFLSLLMREAHFLLQKWMREQIFDVKVRILTF